jgi:hypothetical protein
MVEYYVAAASSYVNNQWRRRRQSGFNQQPSQYAAQPQQQQTFVQASTGIIHIYYLSFAFRQAGIRNQTPKFRDN